eukprot:6215585-Amphidinium_carterae.1
MEVTLPTPLRESEQSRSERLSELVTSAMRTAIAQTSLYGPLPGLERARPGAATPPSAGSESDDVLQW